MTDQTRKQPRLQGNARGFGAMIQWPVLAEIEGLPYASDSRKRDQWLRSFWRLEPRLAGMVNGVTLIDANRGWTLTGGRNQVARYNRVFHDADGGQGWRALCRRLSLSYWCTDMGAIMEIGRDGPDGPLRDMYHVDSARCRLTGEIATPLEYFPKVGGSQRWSATDFVRVASLPSDDEAFNGLGFCAISRCLEIAKVLYAVMVHDQEQLSARAPRGLLLLQNVSEEQWNQSLEARESNLDSMERRYYGGVQVLASAGMDQIDAKLVALSQLPVGFDAKTFVDLSMYAYALCFGYDPSEFWPVQFGSLGRGNEAEAQSVKASSKGGSEFALALQERLQDELPNTLAFEFEERDRDSELADASSDMARLNVIKAAYESGLTSGASLISRQEARTLLAEQGLIPEAWAAVDDEVTVTDTEDMTPEEPTTPNPESAPEDVGEEEPPTEPTPPPAERWLDTERIQRAMRTFPHEPIVQYTWPSGKLRTLWTPRLKPRYWQIARADDESEPVYESGAVVITEQDIDNAIAQGARRVGAEFAQLLDAPTLTDEQLAKLGG